MSAVDLLASRTRRCRFVLCALVCFSSLFYLERKKSGSQNPLKSFLPNLHKCINTPWYFPTILQGSYSHFLKGLVSIPILKCGSRSYQIRVTEISVSSTLHARMDWFRGYGSGTHAGVGAVRLAEPQGPALPYPASYQT